MFGARLGVRTRILMIALIPSLTLLVAGVGVAGYLVDRSYQTRQWIEAMTEAVGPARAMIESVQQERRLTLAHLAGDQEATTALAVSRSRTDDALEGVFTTLPGLRSLDPNAINAEIAEFDTLRQHLATVRSAADARLLPTADGYMFYSRLLEAVTVGTQIAQRTAPDPEIVVEFAMSSQLIHAIESLSRSNALAEAALRADTSVALPDEYVRQVGAYHTGIAQLVAEVHPEFHDRMQSLFTSGAWARLAAMETALIRRSFAPAPGTAEAASAAPVVLPSTLTEWQGATARVDHELLDLWDKHSRYAQDLAHDSATRSATFSVLAGLACAVTAVIAFGISLVLANRFIRRLKRLREETFALADERLPEMMRRLRAGEKIDPEAESPRLDYGRDEIGAVATAFQHAHAAAVAAAVTEARTQEGVKAVFLNIAHRSQVVVHRQLEILDEAERREEDPAMLDTLFRLDHLATRERRNAENLTILGGGTPGRQWRNPVPLVDLVRSAIGETVDYARVRLAKLPDTQIAGGAVADLIHLLAELVDNATSFSPPQARVEVTGSVVGKGVVLEISDQGMGMKADDLARVNETLAEPPDFGVAALSADSRLGLFVVARLAVRHGVMVRLSESDFGGVRATVLVPSALLADGPGASGVVAPPPQRLAAPATDSAAETSTAAAEAGHTATATLVAEPATTSPEPETRPSAAPAQQKPAPLSPPEPQFTADGRPALPRRTRQANLAPQLADSDTPDSAEQRPRSPEQARDLMAAIEIGTKQGRKPLPADDPGVVRGTADASSDEQEG
uniref:sensor histidine kinase n=1 Tax=Nocardia donostiensis TaxID=1538463 RepID=UPI0009D9ACE4|nr:ATP-binding protein [Nocardia donostiensis]